MLTQSPTIIEHLDELRSDPPLLPSDLVARAKVRPVTALIGCDIHPLHNVGPLTMLRRGFGSSEDEVATWNTRWIGDGLAAVEALIAGEAFCFGLQPGLADLYLIPQLYAATRFGISFAHLDKVTRGAGAAAKHPAFQVAHPSRQPDVEPDPSS